MRNGEKLFTILCRELPETNPASTSTSRDTRKEKTARKDTATAYYIQYYHLHTTHRNVMVCWSKDGARRISSEENKMLGENWKESGNAFHRQRPTDDDESTAQWVGGYSGSGVKICNRPRPRHPVGSISEVSIGIPIFIMYSPDCREKNRLNINI